MIDRQALRHLASLLLAGLLTACSQSPRAAAASGAGAQTGPRGSRVGSSQPVAMSEDDPRAPTMAKIDGLIVEWDQAQNTGQVDKARQIEGQIRYEVDTHHAMLHQSARGEQGLAAQYLAVSALGFSSNPESTRTLVKLLASSDERLVGNTLIALKLRADPETPLGPILAWMRKKAPTGPRRYAPLALAKVLDARRRVGRASESGTTVTALTRLADLVDDVDPVVRLHAARAYGVIRTPATVEPLRRLVQDEHARVQWAAAAALAETGDLRGFPTVVRLLDDTPAESRHLIRDILVTYANRMQNAPLTDGQRAQLGTGARAWSRWFSEFKKSKGIQPGSRQDQALGG